MAFPFYVRLRERLSFGSTHTLHHVSHRGATRISASAQPGDGTLMLHGAHYPHRPPGRCRPELLR